MMTIDFMPNDVTTYLVCRRGRNTYRKVRIDIGMKQAIYNALPQCALEVVDATGYVWSRADIRENRGRIILDYKGPPKGLPDPDKKRQEDKEHKARMDRKAVQNEEAQALKIKTKARKEADKAKQIAERSSREKTLKESKAVAETPRAEAANAILADEVSVEVTHERANAPDSDQRTETEGNNDVQRVGGERSDDGETLRRSVHVQVPLMDKVNAQLVRKDERGSESGPDGLYSSDDEPNVLDNRYAPRVRLVSPADEDAGRD